ncbi:MAG: 30S ribosomal protein S1 [Candidatus Levybacteria bacterium]|nr:30S ribosomal protein S1 [Candidatus Levybacteria bacterium]
MVAESSDNTSGTAGSVMARLLASQKTKIVSLHKGDVVKGKITKIARGEVFIDINAKTEALVLEKDRRLLKRLLAVIHEGMEVDCTVITPESESGNPLVSLRRYMENEAWQLLEAMQKEKQSLEVTVTDAIKGGFIVATDSGVTGFLPHSHTASQQQQPSVGKKVKVSLLELNRAENKVIFSQKHAMTEAEFRNITRGFSIGQKVRVEVMNITNFGIFVAVPVSTKGEGEQQTMSPDTPIKSGDKIGVDGLIHISEISWDKVDDLQGLYNVGDTLEAAIIRIDTDARRIDLSVKRLSVDPFEEIAKKYPIDTKVSGAVSKVVAGNVYVAFAVGVEGIIRKEKIPPNMSMNEGKQVTAVVTEIDKRRHRIMLSPVLLEKPIGYR